MPTTAEVVADFCEAFLTMVVTVVPATVLVTDGLPWDDLRDDNICLMDVRVEQSTVTMGTNRARAVDIHLDLWLGAHQPGGGISAAPIVRRRLINKVALIEAQLRNVNPTLGSTVEECALESLNILSPTDPDEVVGGASIEGTATFVATVRVKNF